MGLLLANLMPALVLVVNVAFKIFDWFGAVLIFLLSAITGILFGVAGL